LSRHKPLTVLIIAAQLIGIDAIAATITLKKQAEVDGPCVTLGEIAAITDTDAELAVRLGAVKLGSAPWPGTVRRIDAIVVKLKLYQFGFDPRDISISAKSGCRLTTRGRDIPAERIVKMAREHLLKSMQWPGEDIEIDLVSKPESCTIPAGCGDDVLRPASNRIIRRLGRVNVGVDLLVDDKARFRQSVTFNVRLFERTVVTTRDISRNDKFSSRNVATRRVELKRFPPRRITDIKRVLGRTAARSIAADTPLTPAMIISPPIVKRGDVVNIVYRSPCLKITTSGVARQDGAEGDIITVENMSSRKRLEGRIIDEGTVLVDG